MVARAKVVKAKWGVPSKEPEDMPDFLSNEEIVDKMGGHPRGVFRLHVKKITVVKNKNDDDMLKITAEINETDKDKKGYNGYAFWDNQNITEQSAPFLKQFLKSIGATWKDFHNNTKLSDPGSIDDTTILAIGSVTFSGKSKVFAKVTTRPDNRPEYDNYVIGRWLPKDSDSDAEEDEDEELDEEELEEDEDIELEEADDEDESGEEELREELEELGLVALRKRVKDNDSDAKTTGLKKPALIDLIVEQELDDDFGDEEEEEDEEAEEDDGAEDELREELGELSLVALKRRAKDNGEKVAVLKPIKDKGQLIDIIVEQELGDEEDPNEPPF